MDVVDLIRLCFVFAACTVRRIPKNNPFGSTTLQNIDYGCSVDIDILLGTIIEPPIRRLRCSHERSKQCEFEPEK